MGKFSNYRYLELKNNTSVPHINTQSRLLKQPRRLRKVFFILLIVALCGVYFSGIFTKQSRFLDGVADSLGYYYDYHYAVVIDAGSSGSRVLAYKFKVPFTVSVYQGPVLDLVEEIFEQVKPGLSSYADNPAEGARVLLNLIKRADELVPANKRKDTPLLIRATAGLRLLPQEKADQLIQHVREAIKLSGYEVNSQSVDIMKGSDEGIFIWYTVNLLNNLLDGNTIAALDLGGGSTQITYQVNDATKKSFSKSDLYEVPTGAYNITVFTHSYLNLGLYAARYNIFKAENPNNDTEFVSSCVDPIVQKEPWVYGNKKYLISGAPRPAGEKAAASVERCHAATRAYLQASPRPPHPPPPPVAAMSFYYDVAADAGIIDVMRGGTGRVSSYRAKATTACSNSNIDQPYACIDLVYIWSLLSDFYKMDAEFEVGLYKKVHGHEVSWALGLAYTTVMNRLAQ